MPLTKEQNARLKSALRAAYMTGAKDMKAGEIGTEKEILAAKDMTDDEIDNFIWWILSGKREGRFDSTSD